MPDHVVVVGANHRTSSADLRDRIFIDDASAPAFLERLKAGGIDQAIVLSTCDRVEVQMVAVAPQEARTTVARALAEGAALSREEIEAGLYLHEGAAAVRHILAVASSLDSVVVGEPQVLGQVRSGRQLARRAGMVGPELDAVLQAAFATAKRVRSETEIGQRPVTVVAAATQIARDVHGDIARCAGVLVGTGEMGEFLAGELLQRGLARVTVVAANARRAAAVARRLGGHYAEIDELVAVLAGAEVVIGCAGSGRYLVTGEMMEEVQRRRRRRPVLVLDVAVPSDVEPAVSRVDDTYLYDLEDLEQVALAGKANRQAAAEAAWRIVEEELETFLRGRAARRAVPTLVALRERFEAARREVLAQTGTGDAEEATRLLVNRLLHAPSAALRDAAADDDALLDTAVRRLFGLDGDAGRDDEEDGGEELTEEADKQERQR